MIFAISSVYFDRLSVSIYCKMLSWFLLSILNFEMNFWIVLMAAVLLGLGMKGSSYYF